MQTLVCPLECLLHSNKLQPALAFLISSLLSGASCHDNYPHLTRTKHASPDIVCAFEIGSEEKVWMISRSSWMLFFTCQQLRIVLLPKIKRKWLFCNNSLLVIAQSKNILISAKKCEGALAVFLCDLSTCYQLNKLQVITEVLIYLINSRNLR